MMGFSPSSIKRRAANSPAGPEPTMIIGVADATFLYSFDDFLEWLPHLW